MKQFNSFKPIGKRTVSIVFAAIVLSAITLTAWQWQQIQKIRQEKLEQELIANEVKNTLTEVETELKDLQNSDPHKTNRELQEKITIIETTYEELIFTYEKINDFENSNYPKNQVAELRKLFANLLNQTSKQEYEAVIASFAEINKKIAEYEAEQTKKLLATTQAQTQTQTGGTTTTAGPSAPASNDPPGNGYNRQLVTSDAGQFTVSIVAGDLGSTRVIVDTASSQDCGNDCPVLSLGDYVARNNAYAGINGSYFCPASYPTCAGKTNTFDLLVMNKDKVYFNSENNVYSTNPGVIFSPGSVRFIGQVSGWGRDTGIDSMLSNYPLLVSDGTVVFGGDDDPKKGSKGNRSFVSNKGNIVYIGVVHSATVAEAARVMKAMGMENALNLDNGGSTALWFGGYKAGPGRAIPNAILFTLK